MKLLILSLLIVACAPVKPKLTVTGFTETQTAAIKQFLAPHWPHHHIVISVIPDVNMDEDTLGTALGFGHFCTIRLNASNHLKSFLDRSDWLQAVVLHEFGHCAGLEHVKRSQAIMNASVTPMSLVTEKELKLFQSELDAMREE